MGDAQQGRLKVKIMHNVLLASLSAATLLSVAGAVQAADISFIVCGDELEPRTRRYP